MTLTRYVGWLVARLAERTCDARLSNDPRILDTLGWVHLKRGESGAAAEVLEEAVEARPDSPSIRYRLATALQGSGDSERAAKLLRQALATGTFPEAEDARRQLAKLEKQ